MVRTRGGCSYGYGGEFGFVVEALPGRGTAWCEGVGIGSHPGRVLLRLRGGFGFLVGALRGRGAARCEGVGIDSHPGRVLLRSGGIRFFGRSGCWCLPLISPDRPG